MEPGSNSPGLAEVVGLAIDSFMMEVHTCAPGTVVSYDPSTQTATVQPSLQRTYTGQSPISLPQIENVPVVFPATATAWIRLPVAPGDAVMLHFSERSLDKWLEQGGVTDPAIPHKFCLTDAIAVPGLRSKNAAIVAKGAATSIEMALGNVWLEIMATGQVKLTNGVFDVIQALNTFAQVSSSATTAPQIAAAAATLQLALAPFAGL